MVAELVGKPEISARGNLLMIQKSTIEEPGPVLSQMFSRVQRWSRVYFRFVYVQYALG